MTKIITVTDKNKITISTGQRGPQGIQGPAGSGAALTIQDEGVNLATDATTLNFVGAGISAVGTGATKTITVTGLGGGGSFSGDYNDLVNTPTFATIATSGDYTDLSNLPSLFDGNYNSLTNKPTLFSGSYNDLTNKPTLSTVAGTGDYNDLTNKPTIPTAFSGVYNDLTGKPTLSTVAGTGDYNDLTNKPSTGSTLTIADEGSDLTTDATKLDFVGAGVVVSGTGTTKTVTITGGGAGSFSGSYTDLSNKPNVDDLSVGGDLDMGTNKVLYSNMYANLVDLPSATSYHGMFAHVHATGKAYYAHGGNWVEMANASDITTTLDYTAITNTPTLSTVATSGDYVDLTNKPTLFNGDYVNLTNKPTLGTAAATDTTAYATAAQGTKADTALQAADITGLTDDQTGAEIKTAYEAEANTNAYDDAAVTKLAGIETGADVTDTTNVVAALTAGNNITISAGGEIASTGGGGSAITLEDEGSALTTAATTLNFVGAGVTATGTGATKTITINGGTSGNAMTDSEVKTAYENNTDTNALTDANLTKLTNIEANADVTDTTNVVNALSAGTNVSISAAGVVDVTAAAITSVTVVSSQATQLALSTQQGDVVVRTDTNESYIRNSQSTGTMADFTLLQTPTSGVTSVAGATGVVSTAQLKLAYEALANTNAFTDNEQSKLAGVEPLADVTDTTNVVSALTAGNNISISNAGVIASTTDPMTDSEVKTAYENNLDTNPFTDSDNTKLSNIEANAEVNAVQISAAEITAATETATRSVSPADVKSFIDEHAGASSDMPIARYIDNVGGLNLASTSPVTHTDITTAVVEDTSIYSNSNGVVTVAESGNYMIKAAVGYAGLNYRAILNAKIIKNGTVTLTNVIGGYLRGQGHGDNSYVDLACVCTLAAGDTVQLTTFLNQGNTGTCTAVLGLCTLEFIKLSSSGSGGGSSVTLPDQVSAAEITAGTETAVRLYSPEDVKDMAIEHNPVSLTDEHMAITTSTTTTTTTPGTTVNIGEQDMTDSAWDYHTADGSLIGDNDWTLATRTTTASTDSAGFAMYNIADTSASTANGQQGWQHAGILLTTTECPDNTSITLTTEVLKTSLTKPVQFLAADVDTGFQYQGWVELLSDGTLINQTPANATQITGTPTVVDKTTTWEVTFTVSRGTADMFVHIMPCLRNSDTGAYNKSAVGNCTVSPFRIKGTTPTTTTTTNIVNDLVQDKHIAPTQTTMVDGATLGTVNSNDVAFCIVMGQSNAAGTHGSSPTTASISNVYTMTAGNYNFSSYVNNNSNVYKSQGSNNSNPLTEIAREWQVRKDANPLTTPDLYIINIAKGGTGFAWDINNNSQWDPFRRKNNAVFYTMPVAGTVSDNASLFYTAQKAIREALSQFAKQGKRAFHIGTVWNQWENDTASANAVDRYPANLTLIRKMVDEELGLVDADFYPWRPVADFGTYATHGAQMKRSFDNFAANQNNVYLINTETFTNYTGVSPNFGIFQGDNLHYTQTTQQNAAKFVLDNGYFAVDGAGDSIRRAREVTMKVSDLQGISQMQPDGQVTTVGISDTQTTTATDLNSV